MLALSNIKLMVLKLLLLIWPLLVLENRFTFAYSEATHHLIVKHTIRYMADSTVRSFKYNGWSGKKDYLILLALSGKPEGSSEEIKRGLLSTEYILAKADAETDRWTDVWFSSLVGDMTKFRNIYFTCIGHFLSLRQPGDFWDTDGYYFPEIKAQCDDPIELPLLNWADWGNISVTTSRTSAHERYKQDILVSDSEYDDNFSRTIDEVQFWPIDNLAHYWYQNFLGSKRQRALPADLHYLGPVLHAVQDITVPHHGLGVLTCGHVEYESFVERNYVINGKFFDKEIIREFLTRRGLFQIKDEIKDLITNVGQEALNIFGCTTFLCKLEEMPDETITRKLVNLAIAASVFVLRKAWTEWETEHPLDRPTRGSIEGSETLLVSSKASRLMPVTAQATSCDIAEQDKFLSNQTEDSSGAPSSISPGTRRIEKAKQPVEIQLPPAYVQPARERREVTIRAPSIEKLPAKQFFPVDFLEDPKLSAVKSQIQEDVNAIIGKISLLEKGEINREAFETVSLEYERRLVKSFESIDFEAIKKQAGGSPSFKGFPAVGPSPRPMYRLPTEQEVNDPELWSKYVSNRKRYLRSIELLETMLERVFLKTKLHREKDPAVKKKIISWLNLLQGVQSSLIASLDP